MVKNKPKSIARENLPDAEFKKLLLNEIKNGDISPDQVSVLRDFIDHALILESHSDIEKIAFYLSGREDSLSKSITKSIEYDVQSLIKSIAPIEQWDQWDIRIINLVAYPKWWDTANWDLTANIANQIRQAPEKDYFQTFYSVVMDSGLPEAKIKKECIREFANAYFSNDDVLTSAGRWFLQLLNDSYQETMALIEFDWLPVSIANLLIKCDVEKFEAHFEDFQFKKYENRLSFIELLLHLDKTKYKDYALSIFDKARKPEFHLDVAKILLTHFPDELRERAFDETIKALNILHSDNYFYDDKLNLIRWILENFNTQGIDIVQANYAEENNVARIGYYELLAEILKESALPILVEGFEKFDKNAKKGNVDHPQYVMDLFEILAPFDLTAYEETIWHQVGDTNYSRIRNRLTRFWLKQTADPIATAKHYLANRKSNIRCSAVALLFYIGTAPAKKIISSAIAAEKNKAAKTVMQKYLNELNSPFVEPDIGFDIDDYVKTLNRNCLKVIKKHLQNIEQPINYLKFYHDDLCFDIERILIGREHQYLDLELPEIQSNLPHHVDFMWHAGGPPPKQVKQEGGNIIFAEFLQRHDVDLDDDSLPSWPHTLYTHEILLLGENIKDALTQDGIEVEQDCYICIGDHDSGRDNREAYEYYVKQELEVLIDNPKMLKDYAAICFHSKKKRNWLIDLLKA